ncbi:4Fe-4S single cluster domain-containing protein [Amycolatopsis sp. NPDC005961]|uniref:4Fe-4S single cluster domain-containing protein n=1 Tax=Amycolatopsis sp. NPDC005961 TaxID=3156720 RepID=UPI0033F17E24
MTPATVIRLERLHYPVTALGPGRRLGLWVQGCSLACPGCMSQHTWDPSGGRETTVAAVGDAWREALDDGADGVTISGGEPLQQAGIVSLLAALAEARDRARPEADILLYTGYTTREAELRDPAALAFADAVITGRYARARPTRLIWRGSANQRLVPLTALGRRRYEPYLDAQPAQPPIQVGQDGGDVWLIGVPRSGDLAKLGHAVRDSGIGFTETTWSREEHTRG